MRCIFSAKNAPKFPGVRKSRFPGFPQKKGTSLYVSLGYIKRITGGTLDPQRGSHWSPRAGAPALRPPSTGSRTRGLRGRHVPPGKERVWVVYGHLAPTALEQPLIKKANTLSSRCSHSKIFKTVGGSRGVGNAVCPHEELATIVGKCCVIHAFKAGGAKAPLAAACGKPGVQCSPLWGPSAAALQEQHRA
jgi:hypothetical protein